MLLSDFLPFYLIDDYSYIGLAEAFRILNLKPNIPIERLYSIRFTEIENFSSQNNIDESTIIKCVDKIIEYLAATKKEKLELIQQDEEYLKRRTKLTEQELLNYINGKEILCVLKKLLESTKPTFLLQLIPNSKPADLPTSSLSLQAEFNIRERFTATHPGHKVDL